MMTQCDQTEVATSRERDDSSTLSMSRDALRDSIEHHLKYSLGNDQRLAQASPLDVYWALALAVRDRVVGRMLDTERRYRDADAKRLYYLSMEFLVGRSLDNNLLNLGIHQDCRRILEEADVSLEMILDSEPDAALGNGGLGRLAACFLDSLATLNMPGFGYGINYEYGMFKQGIRQGGQYEKPDHWLAFGTPWEIERTDLACAVPLYGRVEQEQDRHGQYNPMWVGWQHVIGVPHDFPVVGYGGHTVNWMRLYSARSSNEFDMQVFNDGDYFQAVRQKILSETISKVLYPSDSFEAGRELRLIQEYFLVACAVRDAVTRYRKTHDTFDMFASKVAIHLNDTHPALAVAELMRILVDENDLPWDKAWELTRAVSAYTNHTLLPEALEKWSVALLNHVIPRHLQIILEINRRHLDHVESVWPADGARRERMSIVEEGPCQLVRMANLAIVGSHAVNGVSEVHSELVATSLVPDFHELWPEKFHNKTNGITPRRWLLAANPRLSQLITSAIGSDWVADLARLQALEAYADDEGFCREFDEVKLANKRRLVGVIKETTGIVADPNTMFDVQVKRIHEYKRQLLNLMHVIHEYLALVEDGREPVCPRTYIFAGKAAPGYWAAKETIKLINSVGRVINSDRRATGHIKVVFIPDYRVSLAEVIIPAADLSEQISTAGYEASGTSNMKFALNGALTIGTLDGANIEIRQEVGEENIFIFGQTVEEIRRLRETRSYNPWQVYNDDPEIRRVIDAFRSNRFSLDKPGAFDWIFYNVLEHGDMYFHLCDLPSYLSAQQDAGRLYLDRRQWGQKAILNVARMYKFSSDRTILEYAEDTWKLDAVL